MARIVEATETAIREAAAALRAGRLVAFPTETVYGLGAAARDPQAVDLIYRLKGRPRGHPLIVHLPAPESLEEWAVPNDIALHLVERFWPGPLTLVLRRQEMVPDAVTGGQETVALRMPAHPVALALLREFGDALAAPAPAQPAASADKPAAPAAPAASWTSRPSANLSFAWPTATPGCGMISASVDMSVSFNTCWPRAVPTGPPDAPMIATGFPLSDGSSRCSTDA